MRRERRRFMVEHLGPIPPLGHQLRLPRPPTILLTARRCERRSSFGRSQRTLTCASPASDANSGSSWQLAAAIWTPAASLGRPSTSLTDRWQDLTSRVSTLRVHYSATPRT